jgi:hypothetical protein
MRKTTDDHVNQDVFRFLYTENEKLKAQLADAKKDIKLLIALLDERENTPETVAVIEKWSNK